MKKFLALLLTVAMSVVCLGAIAGCSDDDSFKFGMICLHDEASTYDNNFIAAAKQAVKEMGLKDSQLIIKTGIDEKAVCEETADDLVEEGCSLIFADSFGHESWMLNSAKKAADVEFCHATGTMAHTANQANFHNAFASIYEGRYLAGIAAGMKLNEMIAAGTITADQAKMGYVGAFTYAEVMSGYTSFYLGAKSVCPTVKMDVKFTGSWFDVTAEKSAAEALIAGGCKLISQHADSMGAPSACEAANVPNVSYNGSTLASCPNTFIVSSRINWVPYFKYIIKQAMDNKTIENDFVGTLTDESVVLTEINTNAAATGTADAIATAKAKLIEGTLKVFDVSKFTVAGVALTSYMADVDTDAAFTPDTEVIVTKGGITYFDESAKRSAPYFNAEIDGITLLDRNYGD